MRRSIFACAQAGLWRKAVQSSMARRPTAPQPMEHLAGELPARHVGLAVKRSQVFCPVTCPALVINWTWSTDREVSICGYVHACVLCMWAYCARAGLSGTSHVKLPLLMLMAHSPAVHKAECHTRQCIEQNEAWLYIHTYINLHTQQQLHNICKITENNWFNIVRQRHHMDYDLSCPFLLTNDTNLHSTVLLTISGRIWTVVDIGWVKLRVLEELH